MSEGYPQARKARGHAATGSDGRRDGAGRRGDGSRADRGRGAVRRRRRGPRSAPRRLLTCGTRQAAEHVTDLPPALTGPDGAGSGSAHRPGAAVSIADNCSL